MRPYTLLSSTLATLLVASTAAADDAPAGPRPNIVVVDGLAGLWLVHEKRGDEKAEDSSYIGTASSTLSTSHPLRLGYHRALGTLTDGGAVHYGKVTGNISQLVVAPRIGAWFGGESLGVWPRAGVTYGRLKVDLGAFGSTVTLLPVMRKYCGVGVVSTTAEVTFSW